MSEQAEPDSAASAALEGLRRLEARVDALTEAVEVLARGLEGSPMAEPAEYRPEEAARRARELLLLARPGRRGGLGRPQRVPQRAGGGCDDQLWPDPPVPVAS
jgi:hypothetical protein